jgi:hypothetical protein
MKIFSQLNPPPYETEKCTQKDLEILDKVSLTSVVDFMHKFASDATFTPPTVDVLFDSEKYDVGVDDDIEDIFDSDFLENARAND